MKTIFVISFSLLLAFFISKTFRQSKADAIIRLCKAKAQEEQCYADQFEILSKTHSIHEVLSVLSDLKKSGKADQGCHFIAHIIAAEEVQKNRGDWKKTISELPVNECTGGFIMGVIEGYKNYDKFFTLNAKLAPELCRNVSSLSNQSGTDQTCMHTVGHLLLIEHNGNVQRTIEECDKVPSYYQYECYAGMFMENIFRRNLLAHGIGIALPWNEETYKEQKLLCDKYSNSVAQACWRELSHMILDLSNRNMKQVYRRCNESGLEELAKTCYDHAQQTLKLL